MRNAFEANPGSKLVSTIAFNFMPNFESSLDNFAQVLSEKLSDFTLQLQLSDKKGDEGRKRVFINVSDEERDLPILAFAAEDGVRIASERISYDLWRRIAIGFLESGNESFICGQSARIRHLDLQIVLALSRDEEDHYVLLRDHCLRAGSIPAKLCEKRVMDFDLDGLVEYPESHRTRLRITSTQTERSLGQRKAGQQVDPTDDLIFDISCAKATFKPGDLSNPSLMREFYETAERSISAILQNQDIGGPIRD